MSKSGILYMLPLLPLLTRTIMALVFFRQMREPLKEEEKDRQNIRGVILALMGFSFTGAIALFLVNGKVEISLQIPAFYLLTSFLCYLFALNLQSYKDTRWQDNVLGDGLMEAASLSLVLSVGAIVLSSEAGALYRYGLSIFAFVVWLIDHIVRLRKLSGFLWNRR